jgi:dTDP-4-dehydrorhamnose 3,5-epimerase
MMKLRQRRLPGLFDVVAPRLADHRGFLFKPYEIIEFREAGIETVWEQIIHSHTSRSNTVRGLYVQPPPFTEGKLVACLRGEMWWVVVDLRAGSATFAEWEGVHLREGDTILIARGFAHGCLSLSDDVDLLLLADNVHAQADYVGIVWNDPDLAIDWPLLRPDPIISEAHAAYPPFKEFLARHGAIATRKPGA